MSMSVFGTFRCFLAFLEDLATEQNDVECYKQHHYNAEYKQCLACSVIGDGCRVGDYVEVKNSILRDGVKAAHLAYIGDAEVGEGTNIGCGTVFANYDGKFKHRTEVGKNVFVGCNANLIAPIKVGDGAFIAGGSTVTDDVPAGEICFGRARQVNRPKKRKE